MTATDVVTGVDGRAALRQPRAAPPTSVAHLAESVFILGPGPWIPPAQADLGAAAFAVMLLDGLLVREELLDGVSTVQLLAPRDVIDPWPAAGRSVLCGEQVSWSAPEPARLAVLGARFLQAARLSPRLMVELHRGMAAQLERAWRHAAIAQLPHVQQRLVALFCVLGDEHGRVSPDGIAIDLRLTHRTLGRLVGARRPTVSLALKALADRGVVTPAPQGWLLSREATALAPGALVRAAAEANLAPPAGAPDRF